MDFRETKIIHLVWKAPSSSSSTCKFVLLITSFWHIPYSAAPHQIVRWFIHVLSAGIPCLHECVMSKISNAYCYRGTGSIGQCFDCGKSRTHPYSRIYNWTSTIAIVYCVTYFGKGGGGGTVMFTLLINLASNFQRRQQMALPQSHNHPTELHPIPGPYISCYAAQYYFNSPACFRWQCTHDH